MAVDHQSVADRQDSWHNSKTPANRGTRNHESKCVNHFCRDSGFVQQGNQIRSGLRPPPDALVRAPFIAGVVHMNLEFFAEEVVYTEAIGGDLIQVTFSEKPERYDLTEDEIMNCTDRYFMISVLYEFPPAIPTVEWCDGTDHDGGCSTTIMLAGLTTIILTG